MKLSLMVLGGILCLTAAVSALAWGGEGHRVQAGQVLRLLPDGLARMLEDGRVIDLASYPDSFSSFEAELVGREAVAELEALGIRRRYDLHHPTGMAAAFKLLVDALREGQSDRAAVWAASLIHAIGDASGCNHEPIVHTHMYGLRVQGVVRPDGKPWAGPFDPGLFQRDSSWRQVLLEAERDLDRTRIDAWPDDPDEAVVAVMRAALLASDDKVRLTADIIRAVVDEFESGGKDAAPDGSPQSARLLAELTTRGSTLAAGVLTTAGRFARQGRVVRVDGEHLDAYRVIEADHYRNKALTDDALFAELMRNAAPPEDGPAVGVIVEPTYRMNDGVLGFGARFLQGCILRGLKEAGIPYRPLDVRPLALGEGGIHPGEVPLLVLCQWRIHSFSGFSRDALLRSIGMYMEAGGRVIWVGGPPAPVLGPLHQALMEGAGADWQSRHYPVDGALSEGRIRLLPAFTGEDPEMVLSFKADPETPAGWHRPRCPFYFVADHEALRPLIRYQRDETDVVIAAAWEDADGQAKAVFLPAYLLFPFLLSDDMVLKDLGRPGLDRVGRRILLRAIEILDERSALVPR